MAARLLRDDEMDLVARARSDEQPRDWRLRMAVDSVRACAEIVAPRTVAIDDEISRAAHHQVVILGAGLDSRPWRLEALRDAAVISVDHPASQADTRSRARAAALAALARDLKFLPVDLAVAGLGPALAQAGHDRLLPTTWVWEGVVPYLTADAVARTAAAVADSSAQASVLVLNYQTRSLAAYGGRLLTGWLSRRGPNPTITGAEPWRSLWKPGSLRELLGRVGFTVVRDDDLRSLATAWGMPTGHARSLANGRVLMAERVARG